MLRLSTRKVRAGNGLSTRRAITLIELTLVLALAAIVVFVALRAYNQAQANARVQGTATTVASVRSAVATQYGLQPIYTSLTTTQLLTTMPKSVISGTTIINPYQGNVSVGPDTVTTAGDSYYIAVTSVPLDACKRLAVMDLGRSAVAMKVDPANAGGAVGNASATPMTASAATTSCTGATNSVAWQIQ